MQKLSRTEKYRDYRNKLNNDGEREIATKELREFQEKIIFNEKRFGNSSRTENDLNRGFKDTSVDSIFGNRITNDNSNNTSNGLDDIFSELDKYKRYSPSQRKEPDNEKDDYIKKIKEVINNSKVTNYKEEDDIDHRPNDKDDIFEKNENEVLDSSSDFNNLLEEDLRQLYDEQAVDITKDEQLSSVSEEKTEVQQTSEPNQESNTLLKEDEAKSIDDLAEFVEEEPLQQVESQLKDIDLKKPVVNHPVPQYDHSKEFEEICGIVNSLAEEIDESSSFGEDQFVSKVTNNVPKNSLEGIQRDIKKDLINSDEKNSFLNDLEQEVDQYVKQDDKNNDKNSSDSITEDKKRVVKKGEFTEQMKEEYDNTVSLQVDKLMSEIKSSKADNISAVDIIKDNDIAKKDIENNAGKTIAFEVNKKDDVPDNTIILSHPSIEDSSIHTMSFETGELDIEKGDKSNTLLNIVLGVLIVLSFILLAVIVYFFLITRGII